ncbi:MAG: hypothetical protein JWP01_1860 [Myxococcales bacterium]|nr:hypothetical protein [Myxococcales bacterium]
MLGASLLVGTTLAVADEERTAVTVAVGQTVELEVGYAMGHLCDSDSVVRAEMRNKNADTNVFAITGLAAGTTLCRAGTVTVENRPTVLFEITVVAPVRSPATAPKRRR